MNHCTRIRTSRDADEVAVGARQFDTCRGHRPREAAGPIHLTSEQRDLLGRLDEHTAQHRPSRRKVEVRIPTPHRTPRPLDPTIRPTRRGRAARGRHGADDGVLRLTGVRPVRSARTAVAALESLAVHRSPLRRPRP